MIPADVANTLRTQLPNASGATQSQQTQPVPPAQRIADVLSNLVPGQRVFADIQSMLPNGTYRAVIAQRDITLALPFSAKAGDSLELEVVESDGKLSLAVVADRAPQEGRSGQTASVNTSLTSAGKLIGDLMQEIDGQGKRAPAAPLNGNQALVASMPKDGVQLAPILKQALTQSGMFYEAHQARWVRGQLPTEQLRQEPQGKTLVTAQGVPTPFGLPATQTASLPEASPILDRTNAHQPPAQPSNQPVDQASTHTNNPQGSTAANSAAPPSPNTPGTPTGLSIAAAAEGSPQSVRVESPVPTTTTATSIPPDLAPLVQQQLDGLANQNFAWQGQIWPGQKMWWEIGENPEDRNRVGEDATAKWHTRLKLTLPLLGGIDARIHLQSDGELGIRIFSNSNEGETLMREKIPTLHKQLEAAGLSVRQILIDHEPAIEG
ncbi:flagellar hook-length control protein FliK [Azonexus sp.]|uniref:flagellar hook-length control protein FliK n=1 Tax=Azonexus sp. TaxID=1872668 RepID=UPI0027B919EF|nr:flagellar hook-length control protein FliK [Azonexus sp.]